MSSGKTRILVVEDDGLLCAQLGSILDYFGYEPTLAGTCKEARAKFAAEPPDLVLADYYLPDGKGTELLHEFHKAKPKLPVIILTGFPSEESILQTLIEGGYTYLAKPVDLKHLRSVLEHALSK